MADGLRIDLVNEPELLARLGRAIAQLEQPRELLDAIGARLEANVEFRFDNKVAPDGSRWLPIAESTRRAYEADPKNNGTVPGSLLERTRHMRDSLEHVATDRYVDVGFGDAIAGYHETGTRRGLPRRQLLSDDPIAGTLGAQDREDVLEEINAFLAGLL